MHRRISVNIIFRIFVENVKTASNRLPRCTPPRFVSCLLAVKCPKIKVSGVRGLWFDVERGCNTTATVVREVVVVLWFDVERGCNTTYGYTSVRGRALWFDVERGCNTTSRTAIKQGIELWFDVERGCNTTLAVSEPDGLALWFDVERGCNTTSVKAAWWAFRVVV